MNDIISIPIAHSSKTIKYMGQGSAERIADIKTLDFLSNALPALDGEEWLYVKGCYVLSYSGGTLISINENQFKNNSLHDNDIARYSTIIQSKR